jgi:DNA-binding response OmpR family regulator
MAFSRFSRYHEVIDMKERGKSILVVEDDDLLRDGLVHLFAQNGYGVLSAKTGEEALALTLERSPDLIVLDILMPGSMSGIDMLRKLREHEGKEKEQTRVLILSNIKDEGIVTEADEMGSCDYLLKSDWTLDDVLEKVNQKLS